MSTEYYPPGDYSYKATIWRRKMHQLLWVFMAVHPKTEKRLWPIFKRLTTIPESYCFACEQAKGNCALCPIKNWGSGSTFCIENDCTYYEQWLNADFNTRKGQILRRNFALKIAKAWPLPKIKDFNS